ncbi:MAG TPA: TonB-dependent receptor, partial [Caulobacteraceae bacterium]|nr:TonB-dependent receptor [Caulobacteraceae bacterium]
MSYQQGRKAGLSASYKMKRPLAWASGASLLVLAHGAWAQQAPAAAGSPESSTSVESVVVAAPREADKARLKELRAPNIVNVQAIETILKYPDFNAAEALGRIPGVSLSSDTGEGRFVNIRGIDANLNGATYGGVVLLNTNPGGTSAGGGGRAVEFDTVPTGAIDGIVVTKTRLPEQDGEGLGGSVELTPRTAANITKPFLEGTLGWGYEPLHQHTGPFELDVAAGVRFGFNNGHLVVQGDGQEQAPGGSWIVNPTPFSLVVHFSRKDDRRGVDDLEESYTDANAPTTDKQAHQYDFRRYDYHRRRFAYGGEFDFTPNDDHSYYIRGDEFGYIEAVHKNFLLLKKLDGGVNGVLPSGKVGPTGVVLPDPNDPQGLISTTTPQITLTDEQETHINDVFVVGGHDRFGDALIDYRASYSRAIFNVGYNFGAIFSGPTVPIAYNNVTNNEFPSFRFNTDAFNPTPFNPDDPNQYSMTNLSNSSEFDRDEEFGYAVNALLPVRLINQSDELKFGAEIRLRDKTVDPVVFDVPTPSVSLAQFSGPANTYYAGHYTNGPFINRYAIRNLYDSLQASDQISSMTDPNGFFKARENIYAEYGQYSTQVGPFNFLAGVRIETTDATYKALVGTTADQGGAKVTTFAPNQQGQTYTNVFPTAQLKYSITPALIVRAIYTTGIARPGFEQNKDTASVDTTTNPGTVNIVRGNPALKPITGNNFDLSLEYAIPHGGLFEIGLFDKEFSNYIVPRTQRNVTDAADLALIPPNFIGEVVDVTSFLNISSAYARGFEAAYQQKFVFLPKPLDGFGIDSNITIVDSRLLEYNAATSAAGVNEYGSLPGTSHVTWNAAAFYEAYGAELRLAAQYVGP